MNNELDRPTCSCGIFGVFGTDEAAKLTYYGLHALQHRGQEASGIAAAAKNGDGKTHFNLLKGEGLVSEVFDDYEVWGKKVYGSSAIGHNRYSTTGSSQTRKNIQPFLVNYHSGNLAVAHNGNLTNETQLRKDLIREGAIFQTTSDTEVILHLIARSRKKHQTEQIEEALNKIQGAFSLVILTDDKLIAARDPQGFRPLSLGKYDDKFVVASETCAFDIISAEYIREIEPGEMIIIDDEAIRTGVVTSIRLNHEIKSIKHCIFEFIYFSRPDSFIFGHSVDKIRRRLGKQLAINHPVFDPHDEKLVVISVPDSSNTCALGFATEMAKIHKIDAKFEIGLIRSHYIGRTFIEPGQEKRELSVKIKFNTVKGVLKGKTVVLVDDSIVRGTTSKLLIQMIREAEPKSIHMRVSSPPIMYPCYYGMDFPTRDELIANQMAGNIEEIRNYLGLDSLEYLTIDQMLSTSREEPASNFCTACFSGEYPLPVDFNFTKEHHEM